MVTKNFRRTYTIRCGKMGKNGFEIGNIHNEKEITLHVSFSIEKSKTESPNTAKVQIWNLSQKNLKILDSKDCILELKAGYDNHNMLIVVGNIANAITSPDNADSLTEIEVVDGMAALRDTNLSVSLNGSVNSFEVYKMIAGKMGLPIVFAKDLVYKTIPNGFSFVGKGRNALKKIAKVCGHSWTIQNQVIQITWPGRSVSTRGYLLNSSTGLLNRPKRITIGTASDGNKTMTGWEVEYLLNGAIGVNDIVELDSKEAKGYFLVHKVTIDGDNMEGDWMCTAQLLKIKAQTKLDKKAITAKKSR